MSAILSGTVKATLELVSKGDGPAKVKAAEKAVKDYEKSVAATGAAAADTNKKVQSFTSAIQGTKQSIEPLDKARGLFESLRANFLMFPAAIAGFVGGLTDIIGKFLESGSAAERLREMASEYEKNIDRVRERINDLREFLGKPIDGKSLFGADAGDEASLLNDEISTLQDALNDVRRNQEAWRDTLGDTFDKLSISETMYREIARLENDIAEKEAEALRLRTLSAEALERSAVAMAKIRGGALSGFSSGGRRGNVIDLDAFGGPTVIAPPTPRGSGGRPAFDPDREWAEKVARLTAPDSPSARRGGMSDAKFDRLERTISDITGRREPGGEKNDKAGKAGLSARRSMGDDIRDFSAALSEAMPGMEQFSAALAKISDIWGKWGEGATSTKNAVIGSLGAIAQAGAMQIKDERARAGVLSIIMLAMGTAHVLTPGMEAQGAAEITAGIMLAGVAAFSGSRSRGGGGSRAASTAPSNTPRLSNSTDLGGARVSYVIHGNYYGGRAEQEAANDQQRLSRRLVGTGFEGRRR